MFIAVLFIVAKTWRQPKCPLIEDWISKMWYLHAMSYYLAIRKDEILPFENVMPSEISQTENVHEPYDFTHMWDIKPKLIVTNSMVVTRGKGWWLVKDKGSQIHGDRDDLTLGGRHVVGKPGSPC